MNMIDSKIQSTKDFLFSKNIEIDSRNCWMKNCVEWFVGEHNDSSLNELHNFVYDQFLLADLRDVQLNCLPTNILEQEKSILTGKYTLQVDSIQDVSQSCYSQIQIIRGTGKNLNVENQDARSRNHAEGDFSNTRGNHMMKLNMTDGVQKVFGMEYETLSQIRSGFIPGCKVVISGPIEVRRGVFFLKAANFHLLGGELDSLITENSIENILARALNLEENPNARPINILTDLTNNSSTQNTNVTQTQARPPLSNQTIMSNNVLRTNQLHQNSNSSIATSTNQSISNANARTETRSTNQQSFPNYNERIRNDIPDRDDIPEFDEWEESSTSNVHRNGSNNAHRNVTSNAHRNQESNARIRDDIPDFDEWEESNTNNVHRNNTNNANRNQQSTNNARSKDDDIPELDDWEDDEMLNMEVWNTIETSLVGMPPTNPPVSSSTSSSVNTNVLSNNSTVPKLNNNPSTSTFQSSSNSNFLCPPTCRVNPFTSSSNDTSTSVNASSSSTSIPNISNPKALPSNLKRYPSPDLTPPPKRQNTTSYTDSIQSKPLESSLAPPQSLLAPPKSSSPPTRMTLNRIKTSPPPTPFSMVFRGCKVKLVEKLSVSKGAWKLPATITDDGVEFLNVDFSDAVIFNISGVSAADLQSKKKLVTTDPDLRKSIEEMVQNIRTQITNYEGSMKISFTGQKPTVVALPN